MRPQKRIYLSPPYQNGQEVAALQAALSSNWLTTAGPHIDQFEQSLEDYFGRKALLVNSGTAALHLILSHLGIGKGDEVAVSDFTFVACVNPILYVGAKPVLIDSENETWNLCPETLEQCFQDKAKRNRLPKALILVHLYGMPAQTDRILEICQNYGVLLIEDCAEAFGSKLNGRELGTFGSFGFLSFNGNKIITSSGGGAILGESDALNHMLKLSTQAKEIEIFYHHEEIGYNYRMSNLSAALGNAQMSDLGSRVRRKREIFENYKEKLQGIIEFSEEPNGYFSNRWLSCGVVDKTVDVFSLIAELDHSFNIECRPLWKPMHLQPLYKDAQFYNNEISERLFSKGLCLPSGVGLRNEEQEFVIDRIKSII